MNDEPSALHRSFLFCPANNPRRLAKTLTVETDAIIVDLEDAVAANEKDAARGPAVAFLVAPRAQRSVYARVNSLSTRWSFADFQAVVTRGLDGIVLPKVESATDIHIADHLIAGWEAERGLNLGSIDLMPIIETAKGVDAMSAILMASPRVQASLLWRRRLHQRHQHRLVTRQSIVCLC